MPHAITSLCLREGSCIEVCPVECIVAGPVEQGWPWMYIDPETCIDCGACVPECPFEAIFPVDEVPAAYPAKAGQQLNSPRAAECQGRATDAYVGQNYKGEPVMLDHCVTLAEGEVVNLQPDIARNAEFFKSGPGYGR